MMTESAFLQPRDEVTSTDSAPYVSARAGYGNGPFFVLFNVSSGGQGERREALIRKYFEDAGVAARLFPIHRHSILPFVIGHAAELALSAQGTLVIAGGDGTVNSALPSALASGVPLGILPCGTCNHAAQQLGIPLDLQAAVRALVDGEVAEAQVGLVGDRPFLQSASLGLYPSLLKEHGRAARKEKSGRLLALTSAANFLIKRRASSFKIQVQYDSARVWTDAPPQLDVSALFVSNDALQPQTPERDLALALAFASARDLADSPPHLTATALRTPTAAQLIELGARAVLGSTGESKDIPTFSFQRLLVEKHGSTDPTIKVTIDGEVLHMKGPLIVERSQVPVQVIVPATHSTSSTRLVLQQRS